MKEKNIRICERGDNMNKIKSFENIFPFYALPCWKKLGGGKKTKKNLQQRKKNESCAE